MKGQRLVRIQIITKIQKEIAIETSKRVETRIRQEFNLKYKVYLLIFKNIDDEVNKPLC